MKIFKCFSFLVAILITTSSSYGQSGDIPSLVRITFSNTGFPSYVDTFGTGVDYTNCIDKDPRLPYPETEQPPPPPPGNTDARFYDFSGFDPTADCHGTGVKTDIHAGSSYMAVVDTFQYQIQVADKNNPWYITWDTTDLRWKVESIHIEDALTGALVNVDMLTTDSIKLTKTSLGKNVTQFLIYVTWGRQIVYGVSPASPIPRLLFLHQNYPNPFNPSTLIEYDLPSREFVSLKVFNMLGQEVAMLVNGSQEPGYKSIRFDASAAGNIPSGVYIYRITTGTFSDTKKMLLIR